MKSFLSLCLISTIGLSAAAEGGSWASQSNTLFTEEQLANQKKTKNIYSGDIEFEGDLRMRTGNGDFYLYADVHTRYFIFDKISLGAITGYSHFGGIEQFRIGPSFRAYIAEFGKFALSVNQKLVWEHTKFNGGNYYSGGQTNQFTGATGLGLHYFLSPGVALGLNINAVYDNFPKTSGSSGSYRGLETVFGVTVSF